MPLNKLTVIIRDSSPLFIEEPCTYRSVSILLTAEQQSELKLKTVFSSPSHPTVNEVISHCFLEEE